jgi:ribA/ribD-fused uncharacterized protein
MSHVYLLVSSDSQRTYIGATCDPDRRLRQHNGELVGGAKATSGRVWKRALLVSGLPDWRTALQLEWAWKYTSRKLKVRGVDGRIHALQHLLDQEQCTKKARPYKEWVDPICLRLGLAQRGCTEKIERWLAERVSRGSQLQVNILSSDLSTFVPFLSEMSTKSVPSTASSTSADLAILTKAISALAADNASQREQTKALVEAVAANTKLLAGLMALMQKGGAVAPSAVAAPTGAEPAGKGKRGRKPKAEKEPKVKAVAPAPAAGTIRFGPASEGDYKEFSSFYKSPFKVDGAEFASLANFFHSQKFKGTDDDFAEDIRTVKNPALTRAKASSVKDHAPRADWETAKLDVMRTGLTAKFSQNTALKRKLLATGEAPLESTIEEEMRITGFWSVGTDAEGVNHTGTILAEVRAALRDSADEDEEEEEKPAPPVAKPKAKAAAAPKTAAVPKPSAAAKPPAPPAEAESDSDSDSDSDEE